MSEPFDPDATIDERHAAAAPAGPAGATAPAGSEPAADLGGDTVDEWRPRRGAARPAPTGGDTVDEKRPVAVSPCPHCRSLIDAGAVLCPICHQRTGRRAVPEAAVAIIVAVVVVAVVLYFVWGWVSGG